MAVEQKAVFFDRDGVLNNLVKRDGSYYSPQQFKDFNIVEEAEQVIDFVHKLGYLAIVISNQPDVTRGKLEQSELDKMTESLFSQLKVDDVLYCIHDDNNDEGCRKPAPGLLFIAAKKHNINLEESIMVGDTWKDVGAAKNANVPIYLIDKEYNQDLKDVNRIKKLADLINII